MRFASIPYGDLMAGTPILAAMMNNDDLAEPRTGVDKSAIRRGWLLILIIMAIFIALTKVFPNQPTAPSTAPQLIGVAKPSH